MAVRPAIEVAQEALGCRPSGDPPADCIEHGGPWVFTSLTPCIVLAQVAALIEADRRAVRADECEELSDLITAHADALTDPVAVVIFHSLAALVDQRTTVHHQETDHE